MLPIPGPVSGVGFHAIGAFFAANCYSPQKYVKRWSWEIFWMVQAAWCWLLWPVIGAMATIPNLWQVLSDAPKLPMLYVFLLGIAYGVGGTAFNVSIRYIGFSLTYAIAVGLSSILGTLFKPLITGQIREILFQPGTAGALKAGADGALKAGTDGALKAGAGWIMAGLALGVAGIAVCGVAGRFKEGDLRDRSGGPGGFSLSKGLLLSLVAGVLSAVYGIATDIDFIIKPVVDIAKEAGAGDWSGNVVYMLVNPGAFLTALVFSLYLAFKNRSLGELVKLPREREMRAWR